MHAKRRAIFVNFKRVFVLRFDIEERLVSGTDWGTTRPAVLFMASYGRRDRQLSKNAIRRADEIARELGRALISRDIDLAIGGRFDLAVKFVEGATKACADRGISIRDRLTAFFATEFPPQEGADIGQLYRIDD